MTAEHCEALPDENSGFIEAFYSGGFSGSADHLQPR